MSLSIVATYRHSELRRWLCDGSEHILQRWAHHADIEKEHSITHRMHKGSPDARREIEHLPQNSLVTEAIVNPAIVDGKCGDGSDPHCSERAQRRQEHGASCGN